MKIQRNVTVKMYRLRIFTKILCFILVFQFALGDKKCDVQDLTSKQCSETEVCSEQNESCQCLEGYRRINDTYCLKENNSKSQSTPNYSSLVDNQGSGSLVAGILIPLFLIAFVVCGVYASKKYKVLNWIRNKIHQRNENYDEFMIGQDDDDPPLA